MVYFRSDPFVEKLEVFLDYFWSNSEIVQAISLAFSILVEFEHPIDHFSRLCCAESYKGATISGLAERETFA